MLNKNDLFLYNDKCVNPMLNNDLINKLNKDRRIMNMNHIIFSYCYIGIISYLKINNKFLEYNYSVENLREMSGYSKYNKEINYLIKKNGVLDKMGLIYDIHNPYSKIDKNVKNRIKYPSDLVLENPVHKFDIELLLKCFDKGIGISGFYICNFINEFFPEFSFGYPGMAKKFAEMTNIPESTLYHYFPLIRKHKILGNAVFNKNSKGGVTELNLYLRSYLHKWRENCIQTYGNSCFVTGKRKNIIIHHTIPFHRIRDIILKITDLQVKSVEEYTESELTLMVECMLDIHKNIVGIPLTKSIHKLFHKEYGHNCDIVDLYNFKIRYLKGEFSKQR